jgi:carboxyl-terminal processing protease
LKIGGLVPGGSAWKSGNIHNDDKLVQIKPEGEEAIDVKNATSEDVAKILQSKSNKAIQVTVRSADATVKTINLQRQLQRNDENIVKGFVLNGPKKIGYISLPSFYYETSTNGSSSCANDVAKEIVKLKKENIEGLVLDLRYNGGGSMVEAVELSGIFIDAGPVLLVRDKDKKTVVIKDPNRGTIYDGPMAIMINGQSASASELVAGTLQDYKRAIIIGSNSFGKATMQAVLPMDSTNTSADAPSQQTKEFGYVKTTEGKLFRITGKTAQLNGVTPDVPLPDAFEAMDYTERSMPFALPSDTVMKQVYYTPLPPMAIATAAQKSAKRVSENPFFTNMDKIVAELKAMHKETKIPLKWEAYISMMKQENLAEGLIKEKTDTKKAFKIINTSFDDKVMNLDSYQKEMNDYVIADLTGDEYIEEAYQVMIDLINLK